jgi:tRNA pseudouridine38-40 synthase
VRTRRLRIVVAYDGSGFAGWQSQKEGNTIQDQLEAAFTRVTGEKVRVHGAGRTDAGVHAIGQCAHVDLASALESAALQAALNAHLPPTVRVMRCRFVGHDFHARFSARGKIYRYRIATTTVLSPFEIGRVWHVVSSLDLTALKSCADLFIGRHDFANFTANRGKPVKSTIRTIHAVRLRQSSGLLTIEFEGDGFLYRMVRMMVAAMVRCGQGKLTPAEVRQRLLGVVGSGSRMVAPAAGLILVRVRY